MTNDNDTHLKAWLEAEREAVRRELLVAQSGLAKDDPLFSELYQEARDSRQAADALFHVVYERGRTNKLDRSK